MLAGCIATSAAAFKPQMANRKESAVVFLGMTKFATPRAVFGLPALAPGTILLHRLANITPATDNQ